VGLILKKSSLNRRPPRRDEERDTRSGEERAHSVASDGPTMITETGEQVSALPAPACTRVGAVGHYGADERVTVGLADLAERNRIADVVRSRLVGIVTDEADLREITDHIRAVHTSFRGMRDEAIKIGRALAKIQRRSSKAYQALFARDEHGVAVIPFSESVASKMRTLAQWMEERALDQNVLPLSYSGAYEVSRLDEEGFRRFEAEGLLRPETTREQVLAFKRRLRLPSPAQNEASELRRERAKLEARIAVITARLKELEAANEWTSLRGVEG
jgi:hypothetical protein